jgi:hypothetical protein
VGWVSERRRGEMEMWDLISCSYPYLRWRLFHTRARARRGGDHVFVCSCVVIRRGVSLQLAFFIFVHSFCSLPCTLRLAPCALHHFNPPVFTFVSFSNPKRNDSSVSSACLPSDPSTSSSSPDIFCLSLPFASGNYPTNRMANYFLFPP